MPRTSFDCECPQIQPKALMQPSFSHSVVFIFRGANISKFEIRLRKQFYMPNKLKRL